MAFFLRDLMPRSPALAKVSKSVSAKVKRVTVPSWEDMAADRRSWREIRLKAGEEQIQTLAEEKRARQKARTSEADSADSIRTV